MFVASGPLYIRQPHLVRMRMNNPIFRPKGGGGVQQSSLSGQSGHGAAAAHVGAVTLHLELSFGRGSGPLMLACNTQSTTNVTHQKYCMYIYKLRNEAASFSLLSVDL